MPQWEALWEQQFFRFGRPTHEAIPPLWVGITSNALAWKNIWLANQTQPQHILTPPPFSTEILIANLEDLFRRQPIWSFRELLRAFDEPAVWIGIFLCILDWVMQGRLQENTGSNAFMLFMSKALNFAETMYVIAFWGFIGVLWAQESPNSYISISFGAAAPTGSFGISKNYFPSQGYANTGFIVGGQLQTFVMPYFSLGFNAQYLSLPIKTNEIKKQDRLFPDPTDISKANYTLFLGGFGVGTGLRFNAFSFYIPIYLAFASLRVSEIRGDLGNRDYWVQESTGALGVGFSTGALVAIALTDDLGATVNFLYHSLSTKEIEFTQKKYKANGNLDATRVLQGALKPQLTEIGIGLQYYF